MKKKIFIEIKVWFSRRRVQQLLTVGLLPVLLLVVALGAAQAASIVFQVKDINPGPFGSVPRSLTDLNGTLFFQADDGLHGAELWRSDGTLTGTTLVSDINPGANDSVPSSLTNLNGILFFLADDGLRGQELWAANLSINNYLPVILKN